MLKPIRWNTFIWDFIKIEIGFAMFGLAISLMIRANLGTSAWAVLEVLYSNFNDSKYRPAPLLREMVDAGMLGRKTGRGFYTYDK